MYIYTHIIYVHIHIYTHIYTHAHILYIKNILITHTK